MNRLGNNKGFNIYVTGVPVGDNKEYGTTTTESQNFEQIMAENFPPFVQNTSRHINLEIQEDQQTPNRVNPKKQHNQITENKKQRKTS